MSSEYIEWVKLNAEPSSTYSRTGRWRGAVHMLKHTRFDYAGNGEGFARASFAFLSVVCDGSALCFLSPTLLSQGAKEI